jgi:uncharacterized protein (TIGR02646 family)
MREIGKGTEPHSLTLHRKTQHSHYDNYVDKSDLRSALYEEQGGICCYCMSRIVNDPLEMKIEHWQSQSEYPAQQLVYSNLLGACRGGEGLHSDQQHCDTRKGNQALMWNPANPQHHIETRIYYKRDGQICSNDATFNTELEKKVLNLNVPELKNNRKAVLDGVTKWWQKTRDSQKSSPSRLQVEDKINAYLSKKNGKLNPFCQVAIWWLRKKLDNK